MANLPRFGRTWQRFSSLPRPGTAPRPELQPTAFTTEPEVFPSAPATTNILQTSPIRERSSPAISSPVKKFPSPPSSPIYRAAATTSPRKLSLPQTPTYNRYDGERRSSAPSSPKTFKPTSTSPPRSPAKHKYSAASTTAPLSPLALPRSQPTHEPQQMTRSRSPPEVQQKTILYQKTPAEKAEKTDHRPSEYSSGKPHQKQHHQQQQSDVINIKGENVGAVMHITESSGGSTEIHKKKPISVTHNSNENNNESKTNKKSSSSSNLPGKSFMNSNFQGVNNSILYNSSLSHRDPGLHLAFSKKPPTHAHSDHLHDSSH